MSSLPYLRRLIKERLNAAGEEIFRLVEASLVVYEEEVDRQRKLLEIVWKPEVKLQRIEHEEKVLTEQQLCNQERNSSLDQEAPESLQMEEEEICTSQEQEQLELKQEADTFMLTPDNEESNHMEFLSPVAESRDQTGNKRVEKCMESEEEVARQLKIIRKPEVKFQKCTVLTEQERNFSPDHEEQEIKAEPGEICTSQDQDAGTVTLTPDDRESDHMEPEPDTDHQLRSPVAKSRDRTGKKLKKSPKCDTCGKKFEFKHLLISHQSIHMGERPFACKTCCRCYRTKYELVRHMKTHQKNTDVKPYCCETCGKGFLLKTRLAVHKCTHTGDMPLSCDVCHRGFARTDKLALHMRTHTGEKPFFCNICKKCFARQDHLTEHTRTHTGEKRFTCSVCNASFSQKVHLMTHKRTHTGEKPYHCGTCGKSFGDRSSLRKHVCRCAPVLTPDENV
ncbi:zinc finger protein 892-like [Solea solea]|uniref:zinc finger protein 892-like n=1 Tax=Solea solea TaxID=90069 RepID=UPI00272D2599|nr:zinc finger protein 892-like [Solea solea]